MVKKLLSRSAFARHAGVSPTAITKACKSGGPLAGATDGKHIDIDHPDAVEYLRTRHSPGVPPPAGVAEGIDPLYEQAVAICRRTGTVTARVLKQELHIGSTRSSRLAKLIAASGVVQLPEKKIEFGNRTAPRDVFVPLPEVFLPPPRGVGPGEIESPLPGPGEWPGPEIEGMADMTLRELVANFGTDERFKTWLQARKSLVDIGAKEITNAEKRGKLIPRDFVEKHVLGNVDRAHINLMTDAAQTIARKMIPMIKAGATAEECETLVSDQISRHVREVKDSILRGLKNV